MDDLKRIQEDHKKFLRERNWERFQTAKNLSMAVSVEAAELVEIFMWLTDQQANALSPERKQAASDEMADIMIYLLRLADVLGIDLIQACDQKMKKNGEKYSVEKGRALAESLDK